MTPIEVFKCLADNTRVRMVLLIEREQELCVCELTCAMQESQPKISRHLSLLRTCGLLDDRRQGQWVYYRLHPQLPSWIRELLRITGEANYRWLEEQLLRLDSMGDRPARAAASCLPSARNLPDNSVSSFANSLFNQESNMPPHPYFPLACPDQRGALLLTPCPGTLDASLENSLQTLKTAGATVVISLMTEPEMSKNQVGSLKKQSEAMKLAWYHLPVEDEGAPTREFADAWRRVRIDIHTRLDNDEAIAIHCKGGSGRTGVVAAQILMERGTPMQQAVDQVKALRPKAFSHAVHMEYIAQLSSQH